MKIFYLEIALRVMKAENEVPVKTSVKAESKAILGVIEEL